MVRRGEIRAVNLVHAQGHYAVCGGWVLALGGQTLYTPSLPSRRPEQMRRGHGSRLVRQVRRRFEESMDKQEQEHRPQSKRNGGARAFASRGRASGHQRDADTQTIVDEFRMAFKTWAATLEVSPNKLFGLMPDYGRKVHWVRERYFGGVTPSLEDVEWVRLQAIGTQGIAGGIRQEIRVYRYAIAEMCRVCAPEEEDGMPQLCPDAICPLRGVSPLELHPNAHRRLPLSADEA